MTSGYGLTDQQSMWTKISVKLIGYRTGKQTALQHYKKNFIFNYLDST